MYSMFDLSESQAVSACVGGFGQTSGLALVPS